MSQIIVDGRAWPCANLSLSVGGFEDGIANNKGIGGFLVRGDEAKALLDREHSDERPSKPVSEQPPIKRRKADNSNAIHNFFVPREDSRGSPREDMEHEGVYHDASPNETMDFPFHRDNHSTESPKLKLKYFPSNELPPSAQGAVLHSLHQQTIDSYFCSRCKTDVPLKDQTEHEDWHYASDLAKELQAQDRSNSNTPRPPLSVLKPPPSRGRGRPPGGGSAAKGSEKGQKKLAFGKG
jgi:DNA polymerase eta